MTKKKFKMFLIKHIRISHVSWYIVGIPTETNFEHFISLLLIIGGVFLAMTQMKASNFLDPHQKFWVKSAKNLT